MKPWPGLLYPRTHVYIGDYPCHDKHYCTIGWTVDTGQVQIKPQPDQSNHYGWQTEDNHKYQCCLNSIGNEVHGCSHASPPNGSSSPSFLAALLATSFLTGAESPLTAALSLACCLALSLANCCIFRSLLSSGSWSMKL